MKPTKITVRKLGQTDGSLKGYAEVEFDDMLVVRHIRIIEGRNGLFVRMPNRYDKKTDKYYDSVMFKDAWQEDTPGRDYSDRLQAAVLKKFSEEEEFVPSGTSKGSDDFSDKVPF